MKLRSSSTKATRLSGVKGDTATNVTKAATVETGAVIQVPIFIEEGELIQIDTRSGEYLGRAKEEK